MVSIIVVAVKQEETGRLKIPTSIFKDRTVSVLESLVSYLKDVQGMSFNEIALVLNRDTRTVWTVYNRKQKKTEHE